MMGRPSKVTDTIGAVLLVVVGLLYWSGMDETRGDRPSETTVLDFEASSATVVHVSVDGTS